MSGYSSFQNRSCPYFPCHRGVEEKAFNCMFCYCPLYLLGEECGGRFRYTENGIKDCSVCVQPHQNNGYEWVLSRMDMVMEKAKKKTDSEKTP